MKFLKSMVALATVAASAGAFASTDLGTVSPGSTSFFSSTSGTPLFGTNFVDAVTFTLSADAFLSGGAQGFNFAPFTTVLGGVSLYQINDPLEITFDNDANDGFDFGFQTAGSYALVFNGVEQNASNKGYYAGALTVTAVPEPETYAMMLAGLGAIGFMARRRRAG